MLEELKKKLRAYEDAKSDWDNIKDDTCVSSYNDIAVAHGDYQVAYNDLHDFIFQGNITSEDIK